ncbi:MAG: DUF805 domain-containing protein [Bacteroidales bacterium]|nr:DUF805 domain-containing protein [Bacteroidales bacterium]
MKWFIKCFRQYSDFRGRARRKEYWMFTLFNFLITLLFYVVDYCLFFDRYLLTTVYLYVVLFPSFAVAFRRLHDIGKSAWWSLLTIVPYLILIFLVVIIKQGEEAVTFLDTLLIVIGMVLFLAGTIWFIVLMAKDGEVGENKWGVNPKDPAAPTDIVNIDCFKYFSKCFVHYFDFKGRATRSEFWMFIGLSFIIQSIINNFGVVSVGGKTSINIFLTIYSLVVFIPSLAVFVRRYHDIGKSGGWVALPFALIIILAFIIGLFSSSPNVGIILVIFGILLFGLIFVLYALALKDSQPGENKWGPNPKDEESIK